MSIFKRTFMLNEEDKKQVSEMCGKIVLWILEGRGVGYMSEQLRLKPHEVEANINELLYILRKQVGKRRFFKTLFMK